jgi:hypothetical protein
VPVPAKPDPPVDQPAARSPSAPARLLAVWPYAVTALTAIVLSLALQALIWPRVSVPDILIATGTSSPSSGTTATPTPDRPQVQPSATIAAATITDDSVLRLVVLDLEAEDQHLWSAIYLLRTASQIEDALTALQNNDLAEADRTLMAARRSLDRAYMIGPESIKGPIDSFRLRLSQIRDQLRLRPEGTDRDLRQLRRLILSLVDEGT